MLVASINLNRQELADGNDEWRSARMVLDRVPGEEAAGGGWWRRPSRRVPPAARVRVLACGHPLAARPPPRDAPPPPPRPRPEYREKLLRVRRNMVATQALLTKVEKGGVLLRAKLAEKAAERAARRTAEQAAFMNVGGGGSR